MLASKISPRIRTHPIPKIRVMGQTLSSNPNKILETFHKFYSKLYSPSRPDNSPETSSFLRDLPIPTLLPDHRDVLEAEFSAGHKEPQDGFSPWT